MTMQIPRDYTMYAILLAAFLTSSHWSTQTSRNHSVFPWTIYRVHDMHCALCKE